VRRRFEFERGTDTGLPAAVDATSVDSRNSVARGGVSDLSAQQAVVLSALVDVTSAPCPMMRPYIGVSLLHTLRGSGLRVGRSDV
jgi:hypothetical protein